MYNEEERKNENEFAAKCCHTSCCVDPSDTEIAECGQTAGGGGGCHSMMGKCRWFPLIPVVLGVVLLLLGYCLDAEITRVLWMAVAGLTVLLGTFGLIMMGRIKGACCG
ncbi:MAG: hypothetical protein ACYSWW_12380 [Planctomycetota bacterium]|jgi:hypothetical protein